MSYRTCNESFSVDLEDLNHARFSALINDSIWLLIFAFVDISLVTVATKSNRTKHGWQIPST